MPFSSSSGSESDETHPSLVPSRASSQMSTSPLSKRPKDNDDDTALLKNKTDKPVPGENNGVRDGADTNETTSRKDDKTSKHSEYKLF